MSIRTVLPLTAAALVLTAAPADAADRRASATLQKSVRTAAVSVSTMAFGAVSPSSPSVTSSVALPAGKVAVSLFLSGNCPTVKVKIGTGAAVTGGNGAQISGAAATSPFPVQVTGDGCSATYRLGITVTPGTIAPEAAPAIATNVKDVTAYGAKGDGVTDDTSAIRRALDALSPGDVLRFPAGRTFVHRDIIKILKPGVTLSGSATLLAPDPMKSDVVIEADNVTVEGLSFVTKNARERKAEIDQMGLTVWSNTGTVLRKVTVNGSASAGIYVVGSRKFRIEDAVVQNTLSDGIHVTGASSDGTVVRPTVRNTGDDGVAVVSYRNDGAPCRNISVVSPRFYGNTWGRAFAVVGGEDITYTDVYAERSNAAAIYVAAEGVSSWNTFAPKRVTFTGGTLVKSNVNPVVDQGAVLVHSGQPDQIEDVTISDIAIKDTRADASRQVGAYSDYDPAPRRVRFSNISITGGGLPVWVNLPSANYALDGIVWNGSSLAAHRQAW
ncbi:glycosyl hydrolase family 28-related protein [Motilibacter deserti]|uniref:Rhamnogalacturonase A/B/Epimerase-like pectate lyase domain-containing protein n=1 Tax=Motilibacter deserti TaxID=2714956 RepID=A0ABX0GUU6_9ACTN|nr:glycosyl hydrolase family 28-related protein [Motilibacter deserti]NHC13424.1 hypothetical protein [Motilibacter deserti]